MSSDTGPRLPGRRNNGLGATSFLSIGDVDPRVGEHLLDVLLLNGIAAYLQPTVDQDAFTQAMSLPGQPTDRLWVDRSRLAEARQLVTAEIDDAGHTAAPPTASSPEEDDAAWEQIVSTFDQPDTAEVPPWPANEDADASEVREPAEAEFAEPAEPAEPINAEPDETDEEEGYIPPPPPPLPRLSKHTTIALTLIGLGIVLMFAPRFLDITTRQGVTLGFVALVAGMCYLFWNLRDGPTTDDRPDDGAVV